MVSLEVVADRNFFYTDDVWEFVVRKLVDRREDVFYDPPAAVLQTWLSENVADGRRS